MIGFMETIDALDKTKQLEGDKLKKPEKLKSSYEVKQFSQLDRPLTYKNIDERLATSYNKELSEEDKEELKRTGMSDATAKSCSYNENGEIVVNCRNSELVDSKCEKTGVEYERKTIDINGVKLEVVVPKFESIFELKLSENNIQATDAAQFKECNEKLGQALKDNPSLKKEFSSEQLDMIGAGKTPRGYTWHHDAEVGKMQLVKSDVHAHTPHTGGKALWGGGQEYRGGVQHE